jgi:hypothetical protein
MLFLTGFVSSAFAGTAVGGLADTMYIKHFIKTITSANRNL